MLIFRHSQSEADESSEDDGLDLGRIRGNGVDSEDESEEDRSLGRRFVGSDSEIEEDVGEGSSRAWSGGRRASPPKKMIKPSVSTSKRQRAGRGSAVASKQRPLSHNGKGWDMADDSDDM